MSSMSEIQKIAKRMLEADKGLSEYRAGFERISNVQYTLPEPLRSWEWVRPIVSATPYLMLKAGAVALSNLDEQVTVHPISVHVEAEDDESAEARELANNWEKALEWAVARASKRSANFRHSVLWNALVYDEILAQLVHLPTQFKARGLDTTREDAALRYGDWAIQLVNPQEMHVEYSDYMPERVLRVTVKTAQVIVDFWGDAASKVRAKIKRNKDHAKEFYIEFDYVDYENRMVWVAEANSWEQAIEEKGIVILEPEPWLKDLDGKPVPFLPWVAVIGGSVASTNPIFSRRPLLFAVYQAEQWANANIFQTLFGSQAVSEAMAPRDIFTGPGVEEQEVDHTQPGGRIELTQLQKYERIQNLGLDPSLTEAFDRIENAMSLSGSEILITGQPMGGVEAFSAFNLQVQTAVAALGPWQRLGERFYEGLYELLLLIAHYRGEDVVGYGEGLDKYTIDSESIDPANIYLSVELRPDVPVDRTQRLQAAAVMSQNLETPTRKILEWMGETDPMGLMKEYWIEQLNRADMMGRLEKVRKTASGEIEEMAAMMAQQMIEGMMAQQGEGGAAPGPGRTPPNLAGPQGIMGAEGQAFNPAMGMPPPAMASPEGNTREAQTGLTRAGRPVAELP